MCWQASPSSTQLIQSCLGGIEIRLIQVLVSAAGDGGSLALELGARDGGGVEDGPGL